MRRPPARARVHRARAQGALRVRTHLLRAMKPLLRRAERPRPVHLAPLLQARRLARLRRPQARPVVERRQPRALGHPRRLRRPRRLRPPAAHRILRHLRMRAHRKKRVPLVDLHRRHRFLPRAEGALAPTSHRTDSLDSSAMAFQNTSDGVFPDSSAMASSFEALRVFQKRGAPLELVGLE